MPSLRVEVSANVQKIQTDMESVARTVETQLQRVDSFIESTKSAFATLAGAAALYEVFDTLKDRITGAIEATAGLENMAVRTGATVEGLSALAAVARLSGTDTETLASGLTKLDKSLSALGADSPKAVAAFAAIGLSAKDFIGLSADQAFQKVAVAMAGYADGVEKTAALQLIFGKGGAQLAATLRDTADAGGLVAVVTAQQAHEAEEYEKTLRKLNLATDSVFRQLALEAVPAMQSFANAMLEAITGADGAADSVGKLAGDKSITNWADTAALAVARLVDGFRAVKTSFQVVGTWLAGELATFTDPDQASKISAMVDEDLAAIAKAQSGGSFTASVQAQIDARKKQEQQQGPPDWLMTKPKIALGAASEKGEDKAALDQALKTLQAFITSENDLLKQRDEQLKRLFDDNRISIAAYFGGLAENQLAHLAAVEGYYTEEIAAAKAFEASTKGTAAATTAHTKTLEIQAQAERAIQSEGAALAKITDDKAKATEKYTAEVAKLNVELLIQEGHLAEAGRLQTATADKALRDRLTVEGNVGGLGQLAQTEAFKDQQERLNDLKNEASTIEERLATSVGRTNLAVSTGQIGELEGLARTDAARREQIDQLERIADEQIRIAQTVNDNGKSLAAAEAFKLKIDELAASTDTLGKKFNDVFEGTFAASFAKVLDGTESVKKAFASMAQSILQQLSQIAAKDIAASIFGGSSGASGGSGGGGLIGGLLGSLGGLFKGGGAPNYLDAPVLDASVFAGAASGMPYVPQDMLMRVHAGERITPAAENNSYSSVGNTQNTTVHVHMPANQPVTRESAALAGAAVARAVNVASRRNN